MKANRETLYPLLQINRLSEDAKASQAAREIAITIATPLTGH